MPGRGLTEIYIGDGKGKITAAIGLTVRAIGQGKKALKPLSIDPDEQT